jgi:hypothetical protein
MVALVPLRPPVGRLMNAMGGQRRKNALRFFSRTFDETTLLCPSAFAEERQIRTDTVKTNSHETTALTLLSALQFMDFVP